MPGWRVDLPDAAALVTGGAGDLGRPIVAALRGTGLAVGVLDLEPADGPHSLACDVTDPDAVEAAVAALGEELGGFGSVVCAAGIQSEHELADLSPAEFHRVLDASLTGAFLTAKAVVPRMVSGGSIVVLSSGLGFRGMARGAHYAAAKAGLVGLAKSLALELGPLGIRANAVAPGPIRSRMVDGMDPAGIAARGGDAIPLGRLGEPEDVVGPVLFLLSSAAAFVTGAVLHVNGGMLMP
ncbi:MAG: SDR family oxidoreductase [Actinobacteria bacterium]|nr:SDR family oxidoreductase [Actinomycetota bacterium]